ncbi:MAG TPA: hypothetical protein VF486_10615 [Actinomycetes bacterium]
MAPPGPELAVPPEPAELRARTRALAEQDPAGAIALLGEGEWILDQLWEPWGRELERWGMGRERLRQIAADYRRELWLWVMGERTWEQCAGGLLGRVQRRRGDRGPGGLEGEAGTQATGGHARPSGSPPVDQEAPA